jgi:hypothetical protein
MPPIRVTGEMQEPSSEPVSGNTSSTHRPPQTS